MTQEAMLDARRGPAEGGTWLDEAELAAALRQSPRSSPASAWLAPAAIVLLWTAWVSSYFGVPAALLDAAVLILFIAHLWPSWVARESARYFAPRERYVRFRVDAEGIETSSVDRRETRSWHLARSVHFTDAGWLVRFADTPPLWLPRAAFSSEGAAVVESHLAPLPRERRGRTRALSMGIVLVASLAATAAWYWAAR